MYCFANTIVCQNQSKFFFFKKKVYLNVKSTSNVNVAAGCKSQARHSIFEINIMNHLGLFVFHGFNCIQLSEYLPQGETQDRV